MKYFNKFLYFLLGAAFLTAGTVFAINISVPQAPSNGYFLTATSTGAYVASSTQTAYFGNYVATSTNATSSFRGAIAIAGNFNATTTAFTVAASNASFIEKLTSRYVCTGTNDYTGCISPALTAAAISNSCVVLSEGTFNVGSSEIDINRQGGCLEGTSMDGTIITGSNASSTVHIGSRQAGGSLNSFETLANMTIKNTNSGSDEALWIDGMGHNGVLQNLAIYNQSGGKYAWKVEDIDRDTATNIYAQGGSIAVAFSEAGLENTWSNFKADSIVLVPNPSVPTVDWLWGNDIDQSSPQPFSRVELNNVHFFGQNGPIASSTGLMFAQKTNVNTFQLNTALFENLDFGIVGYSEDDYTENNSTHLMDGGTATASIYQAAYSTISLNDNTYEITANVIDVPANSGFPSFTFNGNNRNGGSIGSVFNSFSNIGLLTGTDALFAGDGVLGLGSASQRMATLYGKTLNVNSAFGTSTIAQSGLQIGPSSFNSSGYDNLLTLIPQRTYGNSGNAQYKEGVLDIDSTLSSRIALNIIQQSTAGTGSTPEMVNIQNQSTSATGILEKIKTSSTAFSGNLGLSVEGPVAPAIELNQDTWNGGTNQLGGGLFQISSRDNNLTIDARNDANTGYCRQLDLSPDFSSTTSGTLTLFPCLNAAGSTQLGTGRLNITGTTTVANLVNFDSTNTSTQGDIMVILENGTVGIASSTPSTTAKLSVGGKIYTTSGIVFPDGTLQTTASTGGSSFTGAVNSIVTTNASGNLIATGTQLTTGNFLATSTTATSQIGGQLFAGAAPIAGLGTSNSQFVISQNINNLARQLDLANINMGANAEGGITFENGNSTNAGASSAYIGGLVMGGPNFATAGFGGLAPNGMALFNTDGRLDIGATSANAASSTVNFYAGNNGSFAGGIPDLTLTGGTANLGLGTTSPGARFGIQGMPGGTIPLLLISSSTSSSATSTVLTIDKNGNMAIGGSIPNIGNYTGPVFTIGGGTNNALPANIEILRSIASSQSQIGNTTFGDTTNSTLARFGANSGSTAGKGNIFFSTSAGSSPIEAMRITENQQVGIGTTTPVATLDISQASSTAGTLQTTPFGRLMEMTIQGVWYMVESFDYYGHLYTSGPTPSVSGGTSSMNTPSNDQNGSISVVGTALTSVTMTFAKPWLSAPSCQESDNVLAVGSDITSISSTQVVFGFGTGGVASATIWYRCTGNR